MRASRWSLLLLAGCAGQAAAITCTTGTLIQWPAGAAAPTWEMCAFTPTQSSSSRGSAIELRNVHYNGHLVFKRVNTPVLNVNYVSGCGCYRDWEDEERAFLVYKANPTPGGPPVVASGGPGAFVEAVDAPVTVCDAPNGADIPLSSFRGIAIEKLADRLILTSQLAAGWYRYLVKYTFHADGRIQPRFGFGAVSNNCVAFHNHRHHAYWRFDFDIDGANNDAIGTLADPLRTATGKRVALEEMRILPDAPTTAPYIVLDTLTRRGYQLVPGPENLASPVGGNPSWGGPTWNATTYPFDVADAFMLQYKESGGVAAEIDDGVGFSSSQCALTTNFLNFINGEALNDNGDVVTWYRGGGWHAAGDLNVCAIVGPDLVPVGTW